MDRSLKGPPAANPPSAPSLDEEVHSDEIFREIEDYAIEAKREDRVQASDPPYMCSYWTSDGRREQVHFGELGLQPVEPHSLTPTCDISVKTGYLVFPTRSWVSSLVSLGWGIRLIGMPKMRGRTSLLTAI